MTKNISVIATKDFLKKNLVLCGILILAIVTAAVEPKFLGAANMNNEIDIYPPFEMGAEAKP